MFIERYLQTNTSVADINYITKVIAAYFANIYNITRFYVIDVKSYATGTWIDTNNKIMYLVCNEVALEQAISRSEHIRSECALTEYEKLNDCPY